jgi:hypothetical protein
LPQAVGIGERAFEGCTALTSVSLPQAVTIGFWDGWVDGTFNGCTALASVSLPQAERIGDWAFGGCTALASVSLPQAVTIGSLAFDGCTALASVSLPQAVTIGHEAFDGCTALTSVTLGENPPYLGSGIFQGISRPQTVTVKIPVISKNAYGVPNLPDIPFNNSNTNVNNWGNAFRGKGWTGGSTYNGAEVNGDITLVFETYD